MRRLKVVVMESVGGIAWTMRVPPEEWNGLAERVALEIEGFLAKHDLFIPPGMHLNFIVEPSRRGEQEDGV